MTLAQTDDVNNNDNEQDTKNFDFITCELTAGNRRALRSRTTDKYFTYSIQPHSGNFKCLTGALYTQFTFIAHTHTHTAIRCLCVFGVKSSNITIIIKTTK